jgi:serine/threonine-protein kinase RCK2
VGRYKPFRSVWPVISPISILTIVHSAKDLITHLLCVDPAQRYTIDEFLAHPWCNAAPAPLPEPTPRGDTLPLDSPLLHAVRGGRDGRSPGIASLKEAFDITFAVHRMEEEGARRRAYKGRGGAGRAGFLAGLNEDDEDLSDADEETSVASRSQGQQQQQQHRELYDGRAGQRDMPGRHARPFELSFDGATLLGRRQVRGEQGRIPIDSSPLAKNSEVDAIDVPGSPMQY